MTPILFAVIFACILSLCCNAQIIIDVLKCPGSSLIDELIIEVPSYIFETTLTLRISQSEFQSCPEMETAEYFFKTKEFPVDPIESFTFKANSTYISPLGILSVETKTYKNNEYCLMEYNKSTSKLSLKYCPFDCDNSETFCVKKCCPLGMSLPSKFSNGTQCTPTALNWTRLLYDKESWNILSPNDEAKAKLNLHYVYTHIYNCLPEIWKGREHPHRLLSNGRIIHVPASRRWTLLEDNVDYCIDALVDDVNGDYESFIGRCTEASKQSKERNEIYMYCLFVAAVFYFLTAFIHLVLWDMQNVNGWLIILLSLSMGIMVSFMGNTHRIGINRSEFLRPPPSALCAVHAVLAHFFYLSAFTWLAIINFSMWSKFRRLKPRNSGKNLGPLRYYVMFGFGLPTIVVSVGLALQHLYPERESLVLIPEYGENVCFVAEWAQGVYIYYIIAPLFAIIVILFVLTCITLYKFQIDTKMVRSSSNATERKMTKLFLKLAIVLGIGWIFEFISWTVKEQRTGQDWFWIFPDLYNLLTSVFIFVIFGLKPANLQHLEEKYPKFKPIKDRINRLMAFFKGSEISRESSTANTSASSANNLNAKIGRPIIVISKLKGNN